MTPGLDLSTLSPVAQKLLSADAPAKAQNMAAKGVIMGAKPAEVVTVVALLVHAADPEVATTARASLPKLPEPVLQSALASALLPPVIDVLVELLPLQEAWVRLLLNQPQIGGDAVCSLAGRADERLGELIATNEQLLLSYPKAIEKLYMNKRVRMSTADRVLELAVRHRLELEIPAYRQAAQAILDELIVEASVEPTFDDVLFQQTDEIAQRTALSEGDEDTHDTDDEGEEHVREKFLPLHTQLEQMTVSQKIRRAVLGTAAERMLLVRDNNRLVAAAAASSPQFSDNEAARVAANRNVHEDVLRIIAQNRNFTRNYQVKLNLVGNPKTPLTFSSRLLPHLRDNDLRALVKSKNISANVQTLARQQLVRKETKKH
jgi:hypothetical protein